MKQTSLSQKNTSARQKYPLSAKERINGKGAYNNNYWYWLPASGKGMALIRRQMPPHFPTALKVLASSQNRWSSLTTHCFPPETSWNGPPHNKGELERVLPSPRLRQEAYALSNRRRSLRIMTIAKQLAGSQYQNTLLHTHCSLLIAHYSLLTTHCSLLFDLWGAASSQNICKSLHDEAIRYRGDA